MPRVQGELMHCCARASLRPWVCCMPFSAVQHGTRAPVSCRTATPLPYRLCTALAADADVPTHVLLPHTARHVCRERGVCPSRELRLPYCHTTAVPRMYCLAGYLLLHRSPWMQQGRCSEAEVYARHVSFGYPCTAAPLPCHCVTALQLMMH